MTTKSKNPCQWGYNALGHEVLIHHCGQDVCPNVREVACGFCGERTDALVGQRGRCSRCGSVVFGGRSDSEPSDEVLTAVADALASDPVSPSSIGRRAEVSTTEAARALRWLEAHQMAVAVGNGSWTKYRERRFGELRAVQA